MIDERVLDFIMQIELGILVLAVLVFFTHGVFLFFSSTRVERLVSQGRTSLIRIVSGDGTSRDFENLRSLPRGIKATVFLEMSKNLTGAGKVELQRVAHSSSLVNGARRWCTSRRWSRRLRGARVLAHLEEADPIVRKLLHDRNAAVRAQAAEWAASHPVPGVIDDMLALLADPETISRFSVQDSLFRMGRDIVEPLAKYLETHSGRAAEAGLTLAESMAEPRFLGAALQAAGTGGTGEREIAARLLGSIGGVEAASQLTEMLADPESEVRASAATGLGKMRHWPASSALAGMLADDEWVARRAAAFALRAIGGPGTLLLRRAAKGEKREADIAQMALDIPLPQW